MTKDRCPHCGGELIEYDVYTHTGLEVRQECADIECNEEQRLKEDDELCS